MAVNGRDVWEKCHVPSARNQSATTARRNWHKSPFGLNSYANLWSAFSKMSVTATEFTVITDQVPSGFCPVPRRIEAQYKAGRAWLGLSAVNRAPRLWGPACNCWSDRAEGRIRKGLPGGEITTWCAVDHHISNDDQKSEFSFGTKLCYEIILLIH